MNEFRRLIAGPEPVYAPLVSNPISALLAQAAGFRALYLGGGSMGYIKGGTEANLSLTEMAQAAVDIRTVCPLPLILDGACGWGDPMHVRRTIAMSEAAGFAAIEIEDQLIPKRAHHHIGIEHMIPSELMEAKIRAAAAARHDPDFVIIGRTNALRSAGIAGHAVETVLDVRPHLDAFADDPFHRKAAAVDQGINVFDVESACSGALDSLSCFVHGDATDMEMTSRFVCGKGDAPDLYTKPLTGHWFPGNAGDASELNTAILLPYLGNFATPAGVACKRRAEWTYIPELATLESRPNLWTARVTAM